MKKSTFFVALSCTAGALLLFSCATTAGAGGAAQPSGTQDKTAVPPEKNDTGAQELREFRDLLAGLDLEILSSPGQTVKNRAFSAPFVLRAVGADGNPVGGLGIAVSWPDSRTDDSVSFSTAVITTDADGRASFLPPVPAVAVNSEIRFYPAPARSSPEMTQAAYDAGVTAPYKVKSDYANVPGMLYVYDFNESGRPATNSFQLLQALRNSGVNVGNSPVSDTSYYSRPDPVGALYKAVYNIVGKCDQFLVYGSVRFSGTPEQTDTGFSCTMEADMTCVSMKDGSVLYKTRLTQTSADSSRYNAVEKCRAELAQKTADALIYGM